MLAAYETFASTAGTRVLQVLIDARQETGCPVRSMPPSSGQ